MLLVQVLVTMATVITATSARCQCLCCGDLCGKVLLYLMLIITVCSAINNSNETQDLCMGTAIAPRSAYFLEGEDIVLTCNTPDIPAESLTFVRGSEAEVIGDEYIHKLNDTAIKMIIPNVTAQDIDASKDSTQYKCANKSNNKQCYDNIHVRLEYYPREPVDLDCRVYDFNEMTCTWSLDVNYHRPHDVAVTCETTTFSYKSDNPRASWAPCPDQNRTACHWNSSTYPAALITLTKVSVTAKERNITKETNKTFNKNDIMVPGPVKELFVKRAPGDRCVQLNWTPTHKFYSFRFNVSYTSSCTSEQTRMVYYKGEDYTSMKLDNNRTLCGLSPYTEYTYTVTGQLMVKKERDNQTLIPKGFWSSRERITALTSSDVLDHNPTLTAGLYDVSSASRIGYDSLHLYWTPLTDCDLHDSANNVNYKIVAFNVTQEVKHPNFMATIDVPKSTTLDVTLQAVNSIGPGPSPSVITVYSPDAGPHPSQLVIEYNKTDKGCVTTADIIVSENQPEISDVFHTVVWCKGTKYDCQEPIKWNQLSNIETSFKFVGNLCDEDHRYGLVTHGYHKGQDQIVDTGIHWDRCIYELGKVPDVPLKNVNLTRIQPDNGFTVTWNHYNCDNVKAFITHYMVTYCVGQGSENCKCTKDEVSVNVSRQSSSYSASNLKPGSQYCIWVRGISKAGLGPANRKPLSHVATSKSESSNPMVVIIIIVVVLVVIVLGLALVIRCIYKRYQKMTAECGQIRIPEMEEQGLLDVTSFSNAPPNNSSLTEAGEDVEKAPGDRRYSINDILAVLGNDRNKLTGTYRVPEDIPSYMLAGHNSSQASPAGNDDAVDDQNAPLIQSGDHTVSDTFVTDSTAVKGLEVGQVIQINGRQYIKCHDRYDTDRDHYKSISSMLSDAHSEITGLSVEDLHSYRNSKDFNAVVPNFDNCDISPENIPEKMKGDEINDIERENGNKDVKVHDGKTEKDFERDKTEQMNKSEDINPEQFDDNLMETADGEKANTEKSVGEVEINNDIKTDSSDKENEDSLWDSGDGTHFNTLLNQVDTCNHYKQTSEINLEESCEQSDNNTLNIESNTDNTNADKAVIVDNLEKDADHSHVRNSTDEEYSKSILNKESKTVNLVGDLDHVDDLKNDKLTAIILSNNLNGLISKDKTITSGSSNDSTELQSVTSLDNSGTLQNYVRASNENSSGEPNHYHSNYDLQSNISNVEKNEQIFHTQSMQQCR